MKKGEVRPCLSVTRLKEYSLFRDLVFTGVGVNYFFVCKLWFFSRYLDLVADSDLVLLGRLLHEHGYPRRFKEVSIGRIKIDFLERHGVIHEVKRSRRMEKAYLFQLLYYLYYLRRFGAEVRGVLHYPLLKKDVKVELTAELERKIKAVLEEMKRITSSERAHSGISDILVDSDVSDTSVVFLKTYTYGL